MSTISKEPETDEPKPVADIAAYIDHAKFFWTAEEESAERLSKQVRLLTTLAATVFAAIGYRFSQTYSTQLESVAPVAAAWFLFTVVLFATVFFLPKKMPLVSILIILDAALWFAMWGKIVPSSYLHSAFTGATMATLSWVFVFLLVTMNRLLQPIQEWKKSDVSDQGGNRSRAVIARTIYHIQVVIEKMTQKIIDGQVEDDAPPDIASSGLVLSSGSVAYASRILDRGQWSTFRRQYRAAMTLQGRNIQLRDRVRSAQRSLWTAFSLVPVILLLLIQADASRESEKKPETGSQVAAYTKGVCQ